MSTHVLKVDAENHHKRLDAYLAQHLAQAPSRSFVKKLIEADCVLVNRKTVKAHYNVHEGDEVHVRIPDELLPPQDIEAQDIPLDIFYEDDFLLAVNKAAGMLVHPAQGCYSGTLVNALLFHCDRLSDVNTSFRPGIVHRLDQETSGLLLVAKDNVTHAHLARQFQEHQVKKHYTALVAGEVEFDEGVIDAPLGRHVYQRGKQDVVYTEGAKEAVTFYKVVKRHHGVSLVHLFPRTGRTHQLRVHMSHEGHPILGDEKYGRKGSFPRLALHAQGIGFRHPHYGCFLEFLCKMPREFLEKVDI
ncbi:MAG: hypothetical protein A3G91_00045 [Omnitrophica WOR_2 bacterium RIFCSPLOWO2_12_FULL_50_9]|nr:MAG: hypothetical protein A3D87_07895 [Omnitrophica WOR_2 bacterium RIFCSPHIGHO2_02_FULL_50_17]OGX41164.1 MAG: hypothetical protein A3G91_00045 [Omnitrophica WOR_2 bacterium RIFCSPLOWO2_12_FULL_50_9]